MPFWQIMKDGGPIMWIILFCSVVATFIFLERWFFFHREQVNVGELVSGLINVLKRDGIVEAITLCDNTPGPSAHILLAVILAYERGEEDLRQVVEDSALVEVPRLERRLNLLATVAYIAPLLGLLGTVIGMIQAFQEIHLKGAYITAADLTGSISMALLTTAGGLCVAIPCYIAYNYLISRVEAITLDMEKASSEILYFFKHHQSRKEKEGTVSNDIAPAENQNQAENN
jgi:biopolymer transport protein ExbB